jgi:malonyl CoA-acyl carrier protein transacylase
VGDEAVEGESSIGAQSSHSTLIEEFLENEIRKQLKLESNTPIDHTAGFMQLGLDSFAMFSLSNQINRFYDQKVVSIINLFEHSNILQLTAFIHQQLSTVDQQSSKEEGEKSSKASKTNKEPQEDENTPGPSREIKFELPSDSQEPTSTTIKRTKSSGKELKKPTLVFLFGGHGTLYKNVAVDLCDKVPFIAQQLHECSQHFIPHLKISIEDFVLNSRTDEITSLPVEHAVIFSISYSIAKFWLHIGLDPQYLIGHSLGELVALCISGVLELKDAAHLVFLRARALEKCKGKGQMIAVDHAFLENAQEFNLNVAAINGPKQIVLSGPTKQIEKAKKAAAKRNMPTKLISDEYAFHSKLIKDDHLKRLHAFSWSKVNNNSENIKVVSNVDGEVLNEFNRHYAKQHAKSTVQFWKSIEGNNSILSLKTPISRSLIPRRSDVS